MDFENIGDFLYIILLVVFSIIGAVTRKKKKPVGTEREPQKNIFETLFEEEEYQPQFEPVNEEVEFENEKPDTPLTVQQHKAEKLKQALNFSKEGEAVTLKGELLDDEISDEIFEHSPITDGEIRSEAAGIEIDLSEQEEARKAVIYSEILKPKYINW